MRRLISQLRTSVTYIALVMLYGFFRYWATAGHSPARFPDSLGYQTVRFFGTNERLWAVPLMFSLTSSDPQRVLLQVGVGIVAWAYLAWVLASVSRFRVSIVAAVFAVGLAPQVIRYDIAILSESLGISFAVFATAATIHLARTRSQSRVMRCVWCASILLVAFTRPIHLLVIFVIAAFCIATYLLSGRRKRKTGVVVFGLLSVWAVMQLRGNQSESTLNFYTVLQQRICPDTTQYRWFISHGMPDIPGLCDAHGYVYSFQLKNTVGEILQLPKGQQPLKTMVVGDIEMATWVRDHAWSTYSQYVLTHPSVITSIVRHHATRTLDTTSQGFLPTNSRTVLPYQILSPWWMWMSVGMMSGIIAARKSRFTYSLAICAAITFIVYVGALVTSAVELPRHAATSAVMLRILVLSFVAAATSNKTLTTPDESFAEHDVSSSRGKQKT